LFKELIVLRQIHIEDRHVGHCRKPSAFAHKSGHGFAAKRFLSIERKPQGVVDSALALPRRKQENLQVFLDRAAGMARFQDVIGHAKPAGGKHRVAMAIALERARLAYQPVDHVAVIDPILAPAAKPWQAVDLARAVPDVEMIDADVHIDLFADQAAGQRVDVAADVDRATGIDFRRDSPRHLHASSRQGSQCGLILDETLAAIGVASGHDLLEERLVFAASGEIPASSQHQRLIDGLLEPMMTLFNVAVLIGLARLDRLGCDAVMREQRLISLREQLRVGVGVDRGTHPVGSMPPGNASQFPQGVLQPFAEALEAFAEANRAGLPVGVGEHEVKDKVVKRFAGDRDLELGHVSEVGSGEPPRHVVLREEHLLGRPLQSTPAFDSPLQTAKLNIGKAAQIAILQVDEEGFGLKPGIEPELGFEFGPDVVERVGTGPPGSRRPSLAGETIGIAVLTCRFLVNPHLIGDLSQCGFSLKQCPQPPELPIGEHPSAPSSEEPKKDSLPRFKGREIS